MRGFLGVRIQGGQSITILDSLVEKFLRFVHVGDNVSTQLLDEHTVRDVLLHFELHEALLGLDVATFRYQVRDHVPAHLEGEF